LRLLMDFDQRRALLIYLAFFRTALARGRDGDSGFFRNRAHGFGEAAFIHFHHELKNVAAYAAAKAVVDLLQGVNGERRRFFGMEGAQAGKILAGFFQANVFAHHADDVRLLFDLVGE
jgi:hypothetical protein